MTMDNLKVALWNTWIGIYDSFVGVVNFYQSSKSQQVSSDRQKSTRDGSSRRKKIAHNDEYPVSFRIGQCCLLNGVVFWFSIVIFQYFVHPASLHIINYLLGDGPAAKFVWSWVNPFLSFVFSASWVLPLFCLSKFVNSLWFQDIAEAAFRHIGGRRHQIPTWSKFIADFLFSIFLQALFLVQAMLWNQLPIKFVGYLISLFHMSLLYSLYAFEYKWFNMGWELHKRLMFIENNWSYFLGFGLPLAFVTSLESSYVISGCIFGILFPLLIISANQAVPDLSSNDFSIHIFSPTIWVANSILTNIMKSKGSSNQVTRR